MIVVHLKKKKKRRTLQILPLLDVNMKLLILCSIKASVQKKTTHHVNF